MNNTYERKPNTGTLFVNDRKERDAQPDWSGPILIDKSLIGRIERGEELRLAGWNKESKTGKKMLNVSISEPFEKKAENDDVPF